MSGKPTLTATGYAVRDAKVKPSKGVTDYYVRVFCRLSVEDKPDGGERPNAWFVDALVFGRDRERAAGVGKGDAVAFMGSLSRRRYTGRDGNEREAWSCLCDAFSTSAANPEWYPPEVPEPEVPEVEDIVLEDDDITTLDLPGMDRRHEAEVVAALNLTTEDEPAPEWYPPDPPEEDMDHSPPLDDDDNILPPSTDRRHKAEVVAARVAGRRQDRLPDLAEDDIPF